MSAKIQFTTLACTAALVFAGSVQAAPASPHAGEESMSVRVSVADLDLNQSAGTAVALRRISRAATLICGNEPASAGLLRYSLDRSCRKAAIGNAVSDMNTQIAMARDSRTAPKATALAANR